MYVYLIPRLLNFEIENFLNSRNSFRKFRSLVQKFRSLVASGSCIWFRNFEVVKFKIANFLNSRNSFLKFRGSLVSKFRSCTCICIRFRCFEFANFSELQN